MEFLILGDLEIWDGHRLAPLRPRQERLLARLLLSPNKAVPIGALAEALWDEPPDSAERQVQNAASQLRGAWVHAGVADTGQILRTFRSSYQLTVRPEQLDLTRFRLLVTRAAEMSASDDVEAAVATLREALALWRGPAFDGIKSAVIEAHATMLNEERVVAWEECMRLELRVGRHARVVTELAQLVAEYPFREELTGLLMLALYRAGRQKEALDTYREARARLDDELGIEPGPDLQQLHRRILQNDPALSAAPASAKPGRAASVPAAASEASVPRQIPPRVGHFAGRAEELERLSRDAERVQAIAVTGAAGMGKTALVVQWCHLVKDRYPGGQVFVDLRGHSAQTARTPVGVMEHLLESFQVPPGKIPASLEKQIALYRSLTSEKKILIVLDNANGIEQILPAVPAGGGSRLVVTSRVRLGALHTHLAVSNLTLGPLTWAESWTLLAGHIGQPLPVDEKPAWDRLVELCSGMPLALRIVAARILSEPSLTPTDLVAELSAQEATLDGLAVDGDTRSVRSVLNGAYAALAEADARMFRLLAVHPGTRIKHELAAAVAAVPLRTAKRSIESLAAMHLVNDSGDRYLGMHDLVRLFGEECLNRAEAPGEHVDRLIAWYAAVTADANQIFRPDRNAFLHERPALETNVPPFADKIDAIAFLDGERVNLPAITALAVAHDIRRAVQLIYNLHSYFVRSGFPAADVAAWKLCAEKADGIADPRILAHLHHALGAALAVTQDTEAALHHLAKSAELYETTGDLSGAAGARLGIAWALQSMENYADALRENERALELAQAAGNGTLTVHALHNSADTLISLDELGAGLDRLETALAVAREFSEDQHEAIILSSIGAIFLRKGDTATALEYLREALERFRHLGFRTMEAEALMRIGMAMQRTDQREAETFLRQALELYEDINDSAGAAAVLKLLEESVRQRRG